MAFLNAARPLITDNDSLVIRISGNKEGAISVVIEPHVKLTEPETADAELAALQAALAMPLHLRFNAATSDLDEELSRALAGMTQARQSTVTALTAYEEAQAEARNQAALAAKMKKDKPATAKSATAKPKEQATAAAKPLPAADKASAAPAKPADAPQPPASAPAEQQATIFD